LDILVTVAVRPIQQDLNVTFQVGYGGPETKLQGMVTMPLALEWIIGAILYILGLI
jgi:hypothetical protein